MANGADGGSRTGTSRWRIAGWGIAALLLLLPFVAMQFTCEVNWTDGDFIFPGLMSAALVRSAARQQGFA